jgi:DNA-binding NarL/FixJ family response regulator
VTIRIAIADDDARLRDAVIELLDADPRMEVVGAVGDGDELLVLVSATQPDVVLLDVRMPAGGVAAAQALAGSSNDTSQAPRPLVVALTAETSPGTIRAMLRAGAVGYFAKGGLGSSLGDLIARVHGGEVVLAVPNAQRSLRPGPASP